MSVQDGVDLIMECIRSFNKEELIDWLQNDDMDAIESEVYCMLDNMD